MPNISDLSILLVDDDSLDVEAMKRGFRRQQLSCEIHVARDGVEALEWLRERIVKNHTSSILILLDIRMPRMDGIEFLRELRSDPHWSRAIVFVLTTSTAPEDVAIAYQHSISGFIPKGKIASDYANLIELLRAYCSLVQFPV